MKCGFKIQKNVNDVILIDGGQKNNMYDTKIKL